MSSSDKDPISSENDDGSLSSSLEEKDENASQDSSQELEIDLAVWATKNKCTRSALNELLAILRKQGLRLPKDARTLLRTPRTVDVVEKCGGNYFYMGLENGVLKLIHQNVDYFADLEQIQLTFNIDGVPLFKSTNVQLWPILCSVQGFEPFVVSIFCGNHKPNSVEEYLNDFLMELQEMLQNGIQVNEIIKQVEVFAFICDAPARAFVKCIKGHNAYYSCERCVVKGTWNGRVVFNDEITEAPRTDDGFQNSEYENHQVGKSPLIDIGLSCIKLFSLDYMHLVCLGVVKRMLTFLKQGPRECRLSYQQLTIISENLLNLNGKMPREFARQPRSTDYLDRWKATELCQFLLYTGPIVLKSVVSANVYKHFLSLMIAMSILLNSDENVRSTYIGYARDLLFYFVRNAKVVYGETFSSYNVHALCHLADDVENFESSLNEISAFPFENYLQNLKKCVRKAQNPIAQISKRIKEIEKSNCRRISKRTHLQVGTRKKDSCFMLKNNRIVIIREKRDDQKYVCDMISRRSLTNFFTDPCDSSLIDVYFVPSRRVVYHRILVEHLELERKIVYLPCDGGHVLIPMLHGIERLCA